MYVQELRQLVLVSVSFSCNFAHSPPPARCCCLQVAFDLLEDMRASGLTPSTPTCSALIYACLQNNNFAAARKVGGGHGSTTPGGGWQPCSGKHTRWCGCSSLCMQGMQSLV